MTAPTDSAPSTLGLVERALSAARRARQADPEFDRRPPDHNRASQRRRIAQAFARAHGIDPTDVIVTDDPDRVYGTWRGFLITITESGHPFTFLPVPGFDDVFLAVGPCPACNRDVPLADASDLAAFGRYLDAITNETALPRPLEYRIDAAHAHDCQERSDDDRARQYGL